MDPATIALLILNVLKVGGSLVSAFESAKAGKEFTPEEQAAILSAQKLSEARTDELLTDLETGKLFGGAGGVRGGAAIPGADDLGPPGDEEANA
jgi:hypothetical protein